MKALKHGSSAQSCAGLARMRCLAVILVLLLLPGTALAQKGRLVRGELDSPSLKPNLLGDGSIRPYFVYLPPGYDHTTRRYPVVYALHGYGDDETLLTRVGPAVPSAIPTFLDQAIARRELGEVIVVFVNAFNRLYGSFYLQSEVIGDYESYIVKDLVSQIDSTYRTLAARESRAIVGYSMGAWGTMHLALKFPDIFSIAVATAGFFDSQSEWFAGASKLLAASPPTTLDQFDRLDFPGNSAQALFAGLFPNPQRPPLYSDYPYEIVGGKMTTNTAVLQRGLERDVQNGDLSRYAAQPLRLAAIKLVHGSADPVIPASESMAFTNALAAAGFSSIYEEHPGRHIFRADLALPFVITNLVGPELYIEPPHLAVARETDQWVIHFSTLPGVRYHLESTSSLREEPADWKSVVSIAGDGNSVTLRVSPNEGQAYFRVEATNE